MTDKEQIIIDGVNITGCTWCDFEPNTEPYCRINDGEDLGCEDNPNCYFKQLARKTQECEELKAYAQAQENQRETYYKEFLKLSQENKELKRKVELMMDCPDCKVDEYKKALNEIEELACCIKNFNFGYDELSIGQDIIAYADDILDIINKAKEDNND